VRLSLIKEKKGKVENTYFHKAKERASGLLKDRKRLKTLLINSTKKLSNLNFKNLNLTKLTNRVKVIVRMLKAYVKGEYKMLPWKSLIILVAALFYFVTPLDLIPDVIPVTGYIDDFTVVLWVFRTLQDDINEFIVWENE